MAVTGLVIGKFLPFHHGHQHLIETAARSVDELVVIVCSAAWHEIPAQLRAEWIAESFPSARVVVIDQEERGLGEDGTEAWRRPRSTPWGAARTWSSPRRTTGRGTRAR